MTEILRQISEIATLGTLNYAIIGKHIKTLEKSGFEPLSGVSIFLRHTAKEAGNTEHAKASDLGLYLADMHARAIGKCLEDYLGIGAIIDIEDSKAADDKSSGSISIANSPKDRAEATAKKYSDAVGAIKYGAVPELLHPKFGDLKEASEEVKLAETMGNEKYKHLAFNKGKELSKIILGHQGIGDGFASGQLETPHNVGKVTINIGHSPSNNYLPTSVDAIVGAYLNSHPNSDLMFSLDRDGSLTSMKTWDYHKKNVHNFLNGYGCMAVEKGGKQYIAFMDNEGITLVTKPVLQVLANESMGAPGTGGPNQETVRMLDNMLIE